MSRIIAVAGSGAKAGKTTVCDLIRSYPVFRTWQYVSTSEVLIEDLAKQFLISPDEIRANKERYRKSLVTLGEKDPMYALTKALALADRYDSILFESVRRKCELEYLRSLGATFILVDTSSKVRKERGGPEACNDINEVYEDLIDDRDTVIVNNDLGWNWLHDRVKDIITII